MEIQFAIVRSENREYLCYKAGEAYVDASNPMIAFTAGEDEFEIVEPDSSFRQKEYEFRGERYYLVPRFYRNGWLALILVMVEDEDEYIVLSVNLEEMDALGLPDRTFIDVNNYPDALDFLVENRLATDSGYKRRSGFVEYPMAMLNLPLLYQHNPQIFQKAKHRAIRRRMLLKRIVPKNESVRFRRLNVQDGVLITQSVRYLLCLYRPPSSFYSQPPGYPATARFLL